MQAMESRFSAPLLVPLLLHASGRAEDSSTWPSSQRWAQPSLRAALHSTSTGLPLQWGAHSVFRMAGNIGAPHTHTQ